MATIERKKSHRKPLHEASAVLELVMDEVRAKIPGTPPDLEWNEHRTRVVMKGSLFSADMQVDETIVSVHVKLSFLASMFKSAVTEEIDRTLEHHFPD